MLRSAPAAGIQVRAADLWQQHLDSAGQHLEGVLCEVGTAEVTKPVPGLAA